MATRRRRTHGKAVEEEGGTVKGVRDEARSDILSDLRDGVARAQQGVDLLEDAGGHQHGFMLYSALFLCSLVNLSVGRVRLDEHELSGGDEGTADHGGVELSLDQVGRLDSS
jgi:hypothetical protein